MGEKLFQTSWGFYSSVGKCEKLEEKEINN